MLMKDEGYKNNSRETCQVCVIGSGGGGATAAALLAKRGYDVILLEEGGYFSTTSLSQQPLDALKLVYRNWGMESTTGNVPVQYSESRCLGGATVIDNGVFQRPYEHSLHYWAMLLGSQAVLPEGLAPFFEKIENDHCVNDVPLMLFSHDHRRMMQAAVDMDIHYSRVRRNMYACQGTKTCHLGCPTGAKQSVIGTCIMQDRDTRVRVLTNCRAQALLHSGGEAQSVEAEYGTHEKFKISIKAEDIFIAAGSLQTPRLLYNSGIARKLKHVGEEMQVSPAASCVAEFDSNIQNWKGAIESFYIDELESEGVSIRSSFTTPELLEARMPSTAAFRKLIQEKPGQLSHWEVSVVNSMPGRLRFSHNGDPVPRFNLSLLDRERLLNGLYLLCRLFFKAGASTIHLPIQGRQPLRSMDDLRDLISAKIHKKSLRLHTNSITGTCPMGLYSKTSVVGLNHSLHGFSNVYIVDASVFPSPLSAPPQLTTMALARRAAQIYHEKRIQQYQLAV